MARVVCPRCNNEVDEAADRCPHCGHDLRTSPAREGDPAAEVDAEDRTGAAPPGQEMTADAVDEDEGPVVSPDAAEPAGARGAGGIQWTPILFGFAVFLIGGYVLQFLFAPTVASIVSLGGGMAVAAGTARQRKFLHAALVFGLYFALSLIVTLLAPPPGGAPGGGGGGAP